MKRLIPILAIALGCAPDASAATPAPSNTLRAIRALTNAQASQRLPVAFEATVTFYGRNIKSLDVQDDGIGMYVSVTRDFNLLPGDRVLVNGRTVPSFLPYVISDSITVLKHGTLPDPVKASFDDLVRTKDNCCLLVRVHGVVHAADLVYSAIAPSGRLELLVEGGYIDLEVESLDARVAVGPDQPLVNARDQRHGGNVTGRPLDQQTDGLKAMAHDVFRLRVAGRLLMEQLDGGHLAAFFRSLDAIGQADQPLPHGDGLEESQTQPRPAGGECVKIQGAAVKQVQEAPIAAVAEAEEANQAGDAGPLRAAAEADQDQNHPEEGKESSAGRTQSTHGIKPGDPEGHNIDASMTADSSTVLSVTRLANPHSWRYAFNQ